MRFQEYAVKYYRIQEVIRSKNSNPFEAVLNADNLPCDAILKVDGELMKVVYISDDEYVPVVELLSYTKNDLAAMPSQEFREAYLAYMDNIDIEDMNIENIMNSAREYRENAAKKASLLSKCTQ